METETESDWLEVENEVYIERKESEKEREYIEI